MSSTNFSTGTIIQSTWLNDVNTAVYNTLPTLSSSLKPVAYSGSKSDVGLGNVDNTSDVNKPISTATQTALNLKQDASAKDASGGYAGLTGYNINFKNVAGTFTSAFTNTNTAARTYTFPDKDGTVAMIADIPTPVLPSWTLLGQATVSTAVANIDFLSIFSTSYDKYVIEAEGISVSANDSLALRLANAGTVDVASHYFVDIATDNTSLSSGVYFPMSANTLSTTGSTSVSIELLNANAISLDKALNVHGVYLSSTLSARATIHRGGAYSGVAVSGFRLFWSAGRNFTAGTVRVYGIKNS